MIETARLRLREFAASDFDAVHAYGADPETTAHQLWGPNDREDTLLFLEGTFHARKEIPRTRYELAIVLKETNELIGGCGLYVMTAESREAEIGYTLNRAHWGKGYASETARVLAQHAFDTLKMHRVTATCDARNDKSAHVLEKLGMRREGCLRQHVWTKGRWRDTLVYGVLEDEWRAL